MSSGLALHWLCAFTEDSLLKMFGLPGANDPRVKKQEADQIVDAMRTNQIPVTYVLYSDEGHGFARPNNRHRS